MSVQSPRCTTICSLTRVESFLFSLSIFTRGLYCCIRQQLSLYSTFTDRSHACTHALVCLHTRTHARARAHTHTHMYTHAHMHTHTNTLTNIHTHAYIHTHSRTPTHSHAKCQCVVLAGKVLEQMTDTCTRTLSDTDAPPHVD